MLISAVASRASAARWSRPRALDHHDHLPGPWRAHQGARRLVGDRRRRRRLRSVARRHPHSARLLALELLRQRPGRNRDRALAFNYVPESRADLGHNRFDAAGATTVTAGLLAIVFGIVKAQSWGWGSGKTLGVLAVGVALIAIFVFLESRSAAPLVKLSIFKIRSISTANGVMMLVASALFGMFYFVSLYAQEVLTTAR